MEKRFFEIRADKKEDGPTTLKGYAAVFDSLSGDLGGFREKIQQGAFSEAIKTSDVRALYNHNSDMLPLGRTPETLRLFEDEKGLGVEIDLPDTQFAKDLQKSIERGDINQMSFGFTVSAEGEEWEEQRNGEVVRTLTKISSLFDVSPVAYPAYPDTEVAVRSLDKFKAKKATAKVPMNKIKLKINLNSKEEQ